MDRFSSFQAVANEDSQITLSSRSAFVIPGNYTIVAVEDAWGFEWLQPGVLARYVQHGQELTIGKLMQDSVRLPDPVEVQPR